MPDRLPAYGTVRRNSTHIPYIRAHYSEARRYWAHTGEMLPVDADEAWDALNDNPNARLASCGGHYEIRINSRAWFELYEPDTAPKHTFTNDQMAALSMLCCGGEMAGGAWRTGSGVRVRSDRYMTRILSVLAQRGLVTRVGRVGFRITKRGTALFHQANPHACQR